MAQNLGFRSLFFLVDPDRYTLPSGSSGIQSEGNGDRRSSGGVFQSASADAVNDQRDKANGKTEFQI